MGDKDWRPFVYGGNKAAPVIFLNDHFHKCFVHQSELISIAIISV